MSQGSELAVNPQEVRVRPDETAQSVSTSVTHVQEKDHQIPDVLTIPAGGEGKSAMPEDKKEGKLENLGDDWEYDPMNPRNWSSVKKWTAIAIVSLYTFVSPLGSSMMAPGLPKIAEKYGITNPTILAMTLSIFLISFALGPLVLAPLSEMYGRTWVLHISNLIFLAFNLGCAFSPTTGSLIAFRFFGWLGCCCSHCHRWRQC